VTANLTAQEAEREHASVFFSAPSASSALNSLLEHSMKLNRLGESELKVSEICLGTMTWGVQHSEREAHWQLDFALDHGVNSSTCRDVPGTAERAPTRAPKLSALAGAAKRATAW
jgi:hypothetical protein